MPFALDVEARLVALHWAQAFDKVEHRPAHGRVFSILISLSHSTRPIPISTFARTVTPFISELCRHAQDEFHDRVTRNLRLVYTLRDSQTGTQGRSMHRHVRPNHLLNKTLHFLTG